MKEDINGKQLSVAGLGFVVLGLVSLAISSGLADLFGLAGGLQ